MWRSQFHFKSHMATLQKTQGYFIFFNLLFNTFCFFMCYLLTFFDATLHDCNCSKKERKKLLEQSSYFPFIVLVFCFVLFFGCNVNCYSFICFLMSTVAKKKMFNQKTDDNHNHPAKLQLQINWPERRTLLLSCYFCF
jgi:hypothetical protein